MMAAALSTTTLLAALAGAGGLLLVLGTGLALTRLPVHHTLREVVICTAALAAMVGGVALLAFALGLHSAAG